MGLLFCTHCNLPCIPWTCAFCNQTSAVKLHLTRASLIQFFRMTHFYWLNKDIGETESCETCFSSYCNSRHIILPSSTSSWQKLQQSHDDLLSRNLTSHTSYESACALVCLWGTEGSNLTAPFWSSPRKKSWVIKTTGIKVRAMWHLHCSLLSEDADFQLLTTAFLLAFTQSWGCQFKYCFNLSWLCYFFFVIEQMNLYIKKKKKNSFKYRLYNTPE